MWVRKTHNDMACERRRLWFSLGGPIFCAIITFACCILKGFIGSIRQISYTPSSWVDILVYCAKISIILAIIVYLVQLLFGKPLLSLLLYKSKVMICDKCFRLKNFDGQETCECGGKFENFDLWKWDD